MSLRSSCRSGKRSGELADAKTGTKSGVSVPELRHPSLGPSLMLCGEETIPPTLDSAGPSLCGQRGSTVSSSHTTLKRIASRKVLILLQEVSLAGKAGVEWGTLLVELLDAGQEGVTALATEHRSSGRFSLL